jgi:hypothetical protein
MVRTSSKDKIAVTGQPGQDNCVRIASKGQPGQDSRDRTAGTCQPEQVGLKSQPEQVRLDRQKGQDAQNMTART